MTTIDDLPNELLDEIFVYLYFRISFRVPEIPVPKGRLVNGVCRRWNRPLMTTHLRDYRRFPDDFDLQLEFPRLISMMNIPTENLGNFKGHASLRELGLICDYSSNSIPLYSPILSNCPRLTRLKLDHPGSWLFNNDNIACFMNLCHSLTHLDIELKLDEQVNEKMIRVLNAQDRDQGLVNLKSLTILVYDYDEEIDFRWEFDLVAFCSLFKAPFLESLEIGNALDLQNAYFQDLIDGASEHVTDLKLFNVESNFLSILKLFPNVASLDTGHSRVTFDVMHPTKIHNLTMSNVNPTLNPSMFPHLQDLCIRVSSQTCNNLISDLGLYCPQLGKLTLFGIERGETPIDPDFGNVTFPLLTNLKILGQFLFNESFCRFVARHSKLESLQYRSRGKFQEELTVTDSEMILWPKLVDLILAKDDPSIQILNWPLNWFLKNSPSLVHLNLDMGGYKPTGRESEVAFYCPNLKSLTYIGYLSNESLRKWTRTSNWAMTLTKLELQIKFKLVDLVPLFVFLRTLSRTDDFDMYLIEPVSGNSESNDVVYKEYLDQCPKELKSILMEYCDVLQLWATWQQSGKSQGGYGSIRNSVAAVIRKVLPFSGAKIHVGLPF